jgi:hypothetical protein
MTTDSLRELCCQALRDCELNFVERMEIESFAEALVLMKGDVPFDVEELVLCRLETITLRPWKVS